MARVICDRSCAYCADGACTQFSAVGSADVENATCLGSFERREDFPIGFFKLDFSAMSSRELALVAELLDKLSYCTVNDNPNVTSVWRVMGRIQQLVRGELSSRKTAKALPKVKAFPKKIALLKAKRA